VVARELGVHPTTLSRWRRGFAEDPEYSFPGKGQMKPEKEEPVRVRKENRRLRMENEILKKQLVTLRRTKNEVPVYLREQG